MNRSAITKYNVRQLKIEGNTTLYIRRLCEVFFSALTDTCKEFLKAFPKLYGCFSSFVVWAKDELTTFVRLFSQQVFTNKTMLPSVAHCVAEARRCCDLLAEVGLQMTFVLDGMLLPEVGRILQDHIDLQMEAIKHRAAEDLWRPVNFRNAETLEKFEEEMMDLGFINITNFSYDECFTSLTANTVHFTKSYLAFCDDILKVYCHELHDVITRGILDIMRAQLKHGEQSTRSPDFQKEHKTIVQNASFLTDTLLPQVQERYHDHTGHNLGHTIELKTFLQRIKRVAASSVGEYV